MPHFPARAKRVIFLCMNGGPSHVDMFDYKPELNKHSGVASTVGRDRGGAHLLGSPFKWAQHGQSGLWISEVLPHLAKQADDLCVIRSMQTDLLKPRAGVHPVAHRQAFNSSDRRLAPGLFMDWAAKTPTFRGSSR